MSSYNKVCNSITIFLFLTITGCALFTPHYYDVLSYEHLTALKAWHLKFIDDFTYTENQQWDYTKFKEKQDEGDLKFREALEYEKGKKSKDKLREKAISILYKEFKSNCDFLEQKVEKGKPFFNRVFAEELKKQIGEDYNFAIKGESYRVGSSKNR